MLKLKAIKKDNWTHISKWWILIKLVLFGNNVNLFSCCYHFSCHIWYLENIIYKNNGFIYFASANSLPPYNFSLFIHFPSHFTPCLELFTVHSNIPGFLHSHAFRTCCFLHPSSSSPIRSSSLRCTWHFYS